MTIDNDDLLNSIRESLDRVKYISPEDIPNIDLYMDQVTTFMDSRLQSSARYQDPHQDHDQQLCEKQPAPASREEEILQGACDAAGLHLLL